MRNFLAGLYIAFFIAAPLFFLSGCTAGHTVIKNNLKPGKSIWSGTVEIHGDVEIPKGAWVVIQPGTHILFMPSTNNDLLTEHPHFAGSELIVRGRLTAHGTAVDPIVFRYSEENGAPGSWGGINLMNSEEASFSYGYFRQANSAVHSQESTVYVEESIFENNLVAIRFHSSEILVENNLFKDNGTAIRFHYGAPVICNNRLTANDKGFFITDLPSDYHVRSNVFSENSSYNIVLAEPVNVDVDFSRNWWKEYGSNNFRDSFFDQLRDSGLGRVIVDPPLAAFPSEAGPSWSR